MPRKSGCGSCEFGETSSKSKAHSKAKKPKTRTSSKKSSGKSKTSSSKVCCCCKENNQQRSSSTSAPASLPDSQGNNDPIGQQQVTLPASRGRGANGSTNYRVNFNIFIFLCYAALTVITYTVADYLLELAWPKGGCGCSLRYVYRT